ncbi:MAG: FAD-binding oxidoreductase [Candidatus Dormibacteraeota bacterium]|nr:FAD-binding oxidoreductase [Candidatus Dormibacteraeota bacterium]
MASDRADLVVVGAGTVGGWASYFARVQGAQRVVVIERGRAGVGASSRAAGIVRAQGGNPTTVALGRWSIDFYRGQQARLGTDSGFRELGYMIFAQSADEVRVGKERVAMQRGAGIDVRWLNPHEGVQLNSWLAPESFMGASYLATDGCIDPPRNVLAYSLAMQQAGVELREHTTFVGLRTEVTASGSKLVGIETSAGLIETSRAILTGGPTLHEVGRAAGIEIPAGAVRHQVAVTEPHPAFEVERQAMGFDLGAGLYWRLEEGGLLFGMSNPHEPPGLAREIDWPYMERMRSRLARYLPVTANLALRKAWAATIDYTPDHQPILGPALTAKGDRVSGLTIASAGGHGMMWGPAVAKIAADLALDGRTTVADVHDLGLDRFDDEGRSRLPTDPIALPFPVVVAKEAVPSGSARIPTDPSRTSGGGRKRT